MKKRISIGLAVLLTLSTVITGCSGGKSSSPAADTKVTAGEKKTETEAVTKIDATAHNDEAVMTDEGNLNNTYEAESLVYAILSRPTLNPWGTNNGSEFLPEVYECLFAAESDGTMIPIIADGTKGEFGGYDHEAGSGDYTVYIYDYVTDHQGNHITANDVKWSFEYQFEHEATSGWGAFKNVEVIDDTTCVFHFENELNQIGELKNVLARCYIISEKAWNDSASQLAADMCGTGPYKVKEYVSGSKLVLEKNTDYWQKDELMDQRQIANVKVLTYNFIDEAAQQVIALETGSVDVVASVATSSLKDFQEGGDYNEKFKIYTWTQTGQKYVMANCSSDSICNDLNLRLAMFYAIDPKGICSALGEGTAVPASALMSPVFSDYNPEWEEWDSYQNVTDYDLSKEYLEKSGYNGQEVRLICESVYSTAAEVIQSMLLNAGITVTITTYDKQTLLATKGQSEAWDLFIDQTAGDSGVVMMSHLWNTSNTGENRTENFIEDEEWQKQLELILTEEGHTKENIDAWMQHAFDQAYGMGLYSSLNNIVYRSDIETMIRTDKNVLLPGGFTYAPAE